MFWLECISPIAKGDLKWRDALLVAHRVNSNISFHLLQLYFPQLKISYN